jgi:glucosaminylphosphatidylinositol acyltransferase
MCVLKGEILRNSEGNLGTCVKPFFSSSLFLIQFARYKSLFVNELSYNLVILLMKALEAFHTNHHGSDVFEIVLYILQAPLLALLAQYMLSNTTNVFYIFIVEQLAITIPLLANLTILSGYLWQTLITLLLLNILIYYILPVIILPEKKKLKTMKKSYNVYEYDSVITNFKGIVVLVTCLCILAVDFRVFPRKFSKTEEFGTSLMDIGTGLYVTSSALTSKFARGNNYNHDHHIQQQQQQQQQQQNNVYANINVNKLVAMFSLGILRLISIKSVDYHEHTSEYGIHWNFFLTLACVWFLADILHIVTKTPARNAFLGFILAVIHQFILLYNNNTDYLLNTNRINIFLANREGLMSVSGLLPVYLLGEGFSYACLQGLKNFSRASKFALASCLCWVLWIISSSMVQNTSRRLSNFAYGTITLAVTYLLLFSFQLAQTCFQDKIKYKHGKGDDYENMTILKKITKKSLLVFLLANVMTGIVNICVDTLEMSTSASLCVLVVYAMALTSVMEILQNC